MKRLSIDFGASTTDVVLWEDFAPKKVFSFESSELKVRDLGIFLKEIVPKKWSQVSEIAVTGGKSRFFEIKLPKTIRWKRIDEIVAIGRGGEYLWGKAKVKSEKEKDEEEEEGGTRYLVLDTRKREKKRVVRGEENGGILVVSMGTGTCMVKVNNNHEIAHVGGTGVGGGTFLGLCKELLGEIRIECLIDWFRSGDSRKVDLSVAEIVGAGIGIVPSHATASNLGKLVREIDFEKADKAAGISNLIGQTIGTIAVFGAKAYNLAPIVFTGKLTRIERIMTIIKEVAEVYDMEMVIPQRAEFVAAIGAGLVDRV